MRMWFILRGLASTLLLILVGAVHAQSAPVPILIGIDAEFGVTGSTSAQAIRLGAQIAVDELNASGGLLGGRPLMLVEKDNRSVPARSIRNLREFAADPRVVAVLTGKFSPVVVEALPVIHELKLPLLDPWAAADPITDHPYKPSYVFRLSLRDSWALQVMIDAAERTGRQRIGLLLPNTEWGRSSQRAAQAVVQARSALQLAGVQWYNWGEVSMLEKYQVLRVAGADAIILVANDREGALLVREVAALPAEQRLPIFSHWGITGGTFFENTGAAVLAAVDFSVVQTYSFLDARDPVAMHVIAAIRQRGIDAPRRIEAPVGVAQTYDLVWILARAIDRAGSIERPAVRDALEHVSDYRGLIKYYARPFAPDRHEALALEDVFMARYAADGAIERISTAPR